MFKFVRTQRAHPEPYIDGGNDWLIPQLLYKEDNVRDEEEKISDISLPESVLNEVSVDLSRFEWEQVITWNFWLHLNFLVKCTPQRLIGRES